MGSKGQLRHVISTLARHLDEHRSVVNVGVSYWYTKLDVSPTAPAAGSDQNELSLRQKFVEPADGTTHVAHCGLVGKLAVLICSDINYMGNIRHFTVRNVVI